MTYIGFSNLPVRILWNVVFASNVISSNQSNCTPCLCAFTHWPINIIVAYSDSTTNGSRCARACADCRVYTPFGLLELNTRRFDSYSTAFWLTVQPAKRCRSVWMRDDVHTCNDWSIWYGYMWFNEPYKFIDFFFFFFRCKFNWIVLSLTTAIQWNATGKKKHSRAINNSTINAHSFAIVDCSQRRAHNLHERSQIDHKFSWCIRVCTFIDNRRGWQTTFLFGATLSRPMERTTHPPSNINICSNSSLGTLYGRPIGKRVVTQQRLYGCWRRDLTLTRLPTAVTTHISRAHTHTIQHGNIHFFFSLPKARKKKQQ